MSTTASTTDSGLSGQPSDDIDRQTGPATGSNAESPGSTLNTATTPVKSDNTSSKQGSNDQSGSSDNKGQKA
jgi:hypothetical protein